MSPEEYWHGDAELMGAYRKAYRIQKEERNFELWLQGYYFYMALSTIVQNVLSKKGEKLAEYPKKPIEIFPPTKEEEEQRKEEELENLIQRMNAIGDAIDRKNGKRTST